MILLGLDVMAIFQSLISISSLYEFRLLERSLGGVEERRFGLIERFLEELLLGLSERWRRSFEKERLRERSRRELTDLLERLAGLRERDRLERLGEESLLSLVTKHYKLECSSFNNNTTYGHSRARWPVSPHSLNNYQYLSQ